MHIMSSAECGHGYPVSGTTWFSHKLPKETAQSLLHLGTIIVHGKNFLPRTRGGRLGQQFIKCCQPTKWS